MLATIDGLRRVETAQRNPATWSLRIEKSPTLEASFDAANAIARVSGCELSLARRAMADLPARLNFALYQHQGLRLVRELKKMLVTSRLEPPGRGTADLGRAARAFSDLIGSGNAAPLASGPLARPFVARR